MLIFPLLVFFVFSVFAFSIPVRSKTIFSHLLSAFLLKPTLKTKQTLFAPCNPCNTSLSLTHSFYSERIHKLVLLSVRTSTSVLNSSRRSSKCNLCLFSIGSARRYTAQICLADALGVECGPTKLACHYSPSRVFVCVHTCWPTCTHRGKLPLAS